MKKALVLGIVLAGLLGVMAWGGPTIGIGAGWAENTVFVAPSFGVQWLPDGIGLSSTMHLALAALVTGTDFNLALGGFWEIIEVSYPIFHLTRSGDLGERYGSVRVLAGIGTPFWLESTADEMNLVGWDLGIIFGVSFDNTFGTGVRILGWSNGDTFGAGITWRYDLLTPYR